MLLFRCNANIDSVVVQVYAVVAAAAFDGM